MSATWIYCRGWHSCGRRQPQGFISSWADAMAGISNHLFGKDEEQARQQSSSGDGPRASKEPPSRSNRFQWTLMPSDMSMPEDKEVLGWIRKVGIERD